MGEIHSDAAKELCARIGEPGSKPIDISKFLDDLASADRITAIRGLGRADQRRLYDLVDGFAPVRLTEIVPAATGPLQQVRHYGKNTLPMFTEFEKRFARPSEADPSNPSELIGYNHQTMAPITGPGYFVAVEDPNRAEVLVDYRRVPDRTPEAWPEVQSNERGLSRFVYGFMVDTLRRVSVHVTVGSAARKGKDLGSWFMLCRED